MNTSDCICCLSGEASDSLSQTVSVTAGQGGRQLAAHAAEKAQCFQNSCVRVKAMSARSHAAILTNPFCRKHERELPGPQRPGTLRPTPTLVHTGAPRAPARGPGAQCPPGICPFQASEPSGEPFSSPGRRLTATLQPPQTSPVTPPSFGNQLESTFCREAHLILLR